MVSLILVDKGIAAYLQIVSFEIDTRTCISFFHNALFWQQLLICSMQPSLRKLHKIGTSFAIYIRTNWHFRYYVDWIELNGSIYYTVKHTSYGRISTCYKVFHSPLTRKFGFSEPISKLKGDVSAITPVTLLNSPLKNMIWWRILFCLSLQLSYVSLLDNVQVHKYRKAHGCTFIAGCKIRQNIYVKRDSLTVIATYRYRIHKSTRNITIGWRKSFYAKEKNHWWTLEHRAYWWYLQIDFIQNSI